MLLYVLEYELADTYLAERGKFREEHLRLLQEAADAGELIGAGPLDPPDRSIFVWTSPEPAERFAEADAYRAAGLVLGHTVRGWNVAVGTLA